MQVGDLVRYYGTPSAVGIVLNVETEPYEQAYVLWNDSLHPEWVDLAHSPDVKVINEKTS